MGAAQDGVGGSSAGGGLTSSEAARRLEETGPNRLPEPAMPGIVTVFLRQFLSPFIYILLIAALVSALINQLQSTVFIFAVLVINAAIGTAQEYSAQRAARALRNMVRGTALVLRDGVHQTIDIEAVVPGDHVILASGDKVPADLRLLSARDLAVDESMLTGESLAVIKDPGADVAADAPLADRTNQCFAGSVVTMGRGEGIVEATGSATAIGAIAQGVSARRISAPPLMVRMQRFTLQVSGAIIAAIILLVGLMALKGSYSGTDMVMIGIGLAVSTIPEGLPAALTVALAIGMQRMAKRNVIIRKLVAVEALGSCTMICSDKTGTLTVNKLTITGIVLPEGLHVDVTGTGIGPGAVGAGPRDRLAALCTTGVLANESHLDYAGGEWVSNGDIVDVAFLVLAKKLDLSLTEVRSAQARLDLIPYESQRALSGSLNRHGGEDWLHVKGSPEKILALSSHMDDGAGPVPIDRARIEAQFEALARSGYRIIALARRPAQGADALGQLGGLTFLGMVAMIDPIRPEVRDAVARCRSSGIEVAMVTGDHPSTARAIASDLGLCGPEDPVVTGSAIRSAEADGPAAVDALIRPARVFARIEPQQKERIVSSFMADGHFVAVTGDGVNDAPAMRRANAGIAMGKSGTDVAKETADLIITDDNFASIVNGIEEGRIVYNNIRKVIALLLATGFSAILLFFLTVLTGLPMPMTAVQLLWLNLVANGVQDVALAFEPREGGELTRKPRNPDEPVLDRHVIEHVLVIGSAMGLMAFSVYWFLSQQGVGEDQARNLTLMLMILFGNIHALSSRSETRSLFRISLWSNPFLVAAVPLAQAVHIGAMYTPGLRDVLNIEPIAPTTWLALLGVALVLLVVEEIHKAVLRSRTKA